MFIIRQAMTRFRSEKSPRPVPVDPRERALAVKSRVAKQRGSGRFVEDDRIRAEQIADVKRRLVEQIAADDRPLTERVQEYVIVYDENGDYSGLRPAS